MNRLFLMKAHALIAAFILPVALMYVITGALYTWGTKGSYSKEDYQISLAAPLKADLDELTDLVKHELELLKLHKPEGRPKLKRYGNHFFLEWTGSSKDILLEPTENELIATLSIKYTTWYRNLVQLHKAKGGVAFKVYAVMLAVSISLLLISGFIMAWQTPQLKQLTLLTSFMGLCSFILFVWFS